MSDILLKNVRLADDSDTGAERTIRVRSGLIAGIGSGVGSGREIDLSGSSVFPGFVDIHNHGAIGIDVNAADSDGLLEIGAFLARHGVTAWLPTFVPDSPETYAHVISEIEQAIAVQGDLPVAGIVGVHYEGVFANTQMCGALRPEFFKTFTGTELSELPTLASGAHMMTFAPEIGGGVELARELCKANWIPSIGHTKATTAILDAAYAAGARHMTHFFNAMTGLHHRDIGVVGWGLTRDVTIDIIADGIHVHPELLKFVFKSKGAGSVSLISDSVAPTGLGDGEFDLWGETINVKDGRTQNERGSIAGSVITILDAVRMARRIGVSDAAIAAMASANPARLLGIDDSCGSIDVGKRADLVAIDEAGNVKMAMVGGKIAE